MDRLYQLAALIPAGTPVSAPVTIPWPLEDNQLLSIDIMVPDGPSGTVGFQVSQAQQQIVPWGNSGYLITNDEKIKYEYDDQITSTGLALIGYNTDIYPHTIYLRATITNLPEPGDNPEAAIATQATASDISLGIGDELSVDSLAGGEASAIPPPSPVSTPVKLKTTPYQTKVIATPVKGHKVPPKTATHNAPVTVRRR
jgi:hypothetical protein